MRNKINKEPTITNKIISAALVVLIIIGFMWLSIHKIGLRLDFTTLFQYKDKIGRASCRERV